MAMDYPDIISEYLVANERYETNGVQIAPYLEPEDLPIGGSANLVLFLQSALDVPVEITFKPDLPQTSRFRGSPLLAIGKTELRVALEPAQVGTLFVPVTTTPKAKEGHHQIQLNVSVAVKGQPTRIRPVETRGRFHNELIDDVVGLDLVRVLGLPYKTVSTNKISVPITIRGRAEPREAAPDLATRFQPLWSQDKMKPQNTALQEVSQRRASIVEQLEIEPLFVGLLVESQKRFADAGAPLRVGEAIGLAKVLTYTVQYFMANSDLQDGLLVPMWELANEYDLPTGDLLWVLRYVGFRHLLQLGTALSFGLVRQALGRQPWTVEERRAVISLIGDSVETGQSLPPEFLYIPLLLAVPTISRQVVMEGEDNGHSLRLLQKAKAARDDVFSAPDLAEVNLIFDRLMNAALQSR